MTSKQKGWTLLKKLLFSQEKMLHMKTVMRADVSALLKQKLKILLVHLSQHMSHNIINQSCRDDLTR